MASPEENATKTFDVSDPDVRDWLTRCAAQHFANTPDLRKAFQTAPYVDESHPDYKSGLARYTESFLRSAANDYHDNFAKPGESRR